jgi:hypothetical protein
MDDHLTNQLNAANDNSPQLERGLDPVLPADEVVAPAAPNAAGLEDRSASSISPSTDAALLPGEGRGADVISLKRERITRDPRLTQLDEMIDQAHRLTAERIKYASVEEDPRVEDLYLKQWGMGASTYAKLLTTADKHRKFLLEED